MPTTAEIAEIQRVIEDVVLVVQREIRSAFSVIDISDPRLATDDLLEFVPAVIDMWGDVAATAAADWYDDVRPVVSRYAAVLAPHLPAEQVDAMVRWAVTPGWQAGDWDAALRNLEAGASRLTRDQARNTTRRNSLADPAAGAFVRVARPGACPFCLMLASRGAVYASEESATTVGTGRVRGTRQAGQSFHDNCRCFPSPVFTDDDIPDLNRSLAEQWRQVTAGQRDQFRAWSEHIASTRP